MGLELRNRTAAPDGPCQLSSLTQPPGKQSNLVEKPLSTGERKAVLGDRSVQCMSSAGC